MSNTNSPLWWWQVITAAPSLIKGIVDAFRKPAEERAENKRVKELEDLNDEEAKYRKKLSKGKLTAAQFDQLQAKIEERRAELTAK